MKIKFILCENQTNLLEEVIKKTKVFHTSSQADLTKKKKVEIQFT